MTTRNTSKKSRLVGDTTVRRDLRERLLQLNFHSFAQTMAILAEKLGYENVALSGRKNWKGRNRNGGYDLQATLPLSIGTRHTIIQLKQYDTLAVYQRSIDELRGTCLRIGAGQALLITTGSFAASVVRSMHRLHDTPVAPVRLIDGDMLLDLLIQHRVGVWEEAGSTADAPARFAVDTAFFAELSRGHTGNSRLDCKGDPRFIVTVQVQPLRAGRTGHRFHQMGQQSIQLLAS